LLDSLWIFVRQVTAAAPGQRQQAPARRRSGPPRRAITDVESADNS
jgi:hypothetical protein